ncbi:MAG: NAD(P)-dependent oxidoreductase [Candidatus Promineifilaceae bacterium]
MRIAITGSCGRIGRALSQLALSQGHRVVSIDQVPLVDEWAAPDLTHIETDLQDYAAFEQALIGCDALVHLAAISSPMNHPAYVVHNTNVVLNYNALSAAAHLGLNRVCLASSINAIGAIFSRWPRYDYFPLDEQHPTYNEDAYSLSKWLGELQADAFARRYGEMSIASLRLHGTVPSRPAPLNLESTQAAQAAKQLWGYTNLNAAARACLLALTAPFTGHERFYIVASDTMMDVPSRQLKKRYFPDVPLHGDLSGHRSFFDCAKAERLLGWKHEEENV